MIYKQITEGDFIDEFIGSSYNDNFTYNGKKALFKYLDDLSDEIDDDIELDICAISSEYTEYELAIERAREHSTFSLSDEDLSEDEQEEEALEYLRDNTTVIEFSGGVIVADF
jgi:hypothetical protein